MPVFSKKLGSINANDPNTMRLLANHIRIMQEELEYRLSVLDSSNISEIDTDVTKVYSIEADEKIILNVGDINKKYTELKVAVDGVTITDETGTTRIKGSSIETGSLVLTGRIEFDDLDSSTQSKINNAGGISEARARTLITSTLVSSPTIAGAEFTNLSQGAYLIMGERDTGGVYGDLHLYSRSSTNEWEVFGVNDGVGTATISLYESPVLSFDASTEVVLPQGDWDFRWANVSGVTAVFA